LVDARAGTVTGAVNLGWARVELAKEVRRRLPRDLPVYIEKDTNAGVLGEMYFGNAKGSRDVVLLTIGTGFGAGVISDGHLIIGGRTAATDIGHLSLDPAGRACICGARGCLETTLSGAGVLTVAREIAKAGRHPTSLPSGETWTPAQILTAARGNDPLAVAVIDEMARVLGAALGMCAVLFDPDCIIVGGGFGDASADLLLPRAEKAMLGHMGPARVRPKILPSAVRSSAVGAACIAFAGAS
jgi:glucokinase